MLSFLLHPLQSVMPKIWCLQHYLAIVEFDPVEFGSSGILSHSEAVPIASKCHHHQNSTSGQSLLTSVVWQSKTFQVWFLSQLLGHVLWPSITTDRLQVLHNCKLLLYAFTAH